ncbi:hypothetical protein BC827DRAFT_658462 [Russula dissimulans]|nr:hypothetical protein BC827DRAFT_658462 [Russula dissimulans]
MGKNRQVAQQYVGKNSKTFREKRKRTGTGMIEIRKRGGVCPGPVLWGACVVVLYVCMWVHMWMADAGKPRLAARLGLDKKVSTAEASCQSSQKICVPALACLHARSRAPPPPHFLPLQYTRTTCTHTLALSHGDLVSPPSLPNQPSFSRVLRDSDCSHQVRRPATERTGRNGQPDERVSPVSPVSKGVALRGRALYLSAVCVVPVSVSVCLSRHWTTIRL